MNHLERLAERVVNDPLFLAFALSLFAKSEQLDDKALAIKLGCTRENLAMIRLCRFPELDPMAFSRDIDLIAARFGADPSALGQAVRRGQVLAKFRAADVPERGTLLAAREDDRNENQP
jgi:hypothetical protein